FYSALPDWMGIYTMQRQLLSLFSSTMISATIVLLAKRKMKWLLRLAPVSTISIIAANAVFLYTERIQFLPQLTTQFPLELIALVLIPSIISIAAAKKLYWKIKTRHKLSKECMNQEVNNSQNPATNPHYVSDSENPKSTYSMIGENRRLTKIEKAYGVKGRKYVSNPNPNINFGNKTKNTWEDSLMRFLESEKSKKRSYVKLFPEEQWDEDDEK
ncbi:MAG: hypothetical protein QXS27_08865, partial [Candidatus Jordarchaeaceae archaeon]